MSNHLYVDIQVDEARRSKISMLEIHKAWRKIMRIAKVEELRNDIVWLSAKHVHQVHHLFPLFFTCFHCCNLLHGRLEFCVVYLYVSDVTMETACTGGGKGSHHCNISKNTG